MLVNEGMVKNDSFCAIMSLVMVFGKLDGDWFVVIWDLILKFGYVL